MARDDESFLSRWSRRKLGSAKTPAAVPDTPAPELPPLDSLTPDSDYSAFMHHKVEEQVRRAALRKLFSDPRFNVVDGLDDYAEDFTQLENLATDLAASLEHAKTTLAGPQPEPGEAAAAAAAPGAPQAPSTAEGPAELAQAPGQPPEEEQPPAEPGSPGDRA